MFKNAAEDSNGWENAIKDDDIDHPLLIKSGCGARCCPAFFTVRRWHCVDPVVCRREKQKKDGFQPLGCGFSTSDYEGWNEHHRTSSECHRTCWICHYKAVDLIEHQPKETRETPTNDKPGDMITLTIQKPDPHHVFASKRLLVNHIIAEHDDSYCEWCQFSFAKRSENAPGGTGRRLSRVEHEFKFHAGACLLCWKIPGISNIRQHYKDVHGEDVTPDHSGMVKPQILDPRLNETNSTSGVVSSRPAEPLQRTKMFVHTSNTFNDKFEWVCRYCTHKMDDRIDRNKHYILQHREDIFKDPKDVDMQHQWDYLSDRRGSDPQNAKAKGDTSPTTLRIRSHRNSAHVSPRPVPPRIPQVTHYLPPYPNGFPYRNHVEPPGRGIGNPSQHQNQPWSYEEPQVGLQTLPYDNQPILSDVMLPSEQANIIPYHNNHHPTKSPPSSEMRPAHAIQAGTANGVEHINVTPPLFQPYGTGGFHPEGFYPVQQPMQQGQLLNGVQYVGPGPVGRLPFRPGPGAFAPAYPYPPQPQFTPPIPHQGFWDNSGSNRSPPPGPAPNYHNNHSTVRNHWTRQNRRPNNGPSRGNDQNNGAQSPGTQDQGVGSGLLHRTNPNLPARPSWIDLPVYGSTEAIIEETQVSDRPASGNDEETQVSNRPASGDDEETEEQDVKSQTFDDILESCYNEHPPFYNYTDGKDGRCRRTLSCSLA